MAIIHFFVYNQEAVLVLEIRLSGNKHYFYDGQSKLHFQAEMICGHFNLTFVEFDHCPAILNTSNKEKQKAKSPLAGESKNQRGGP